MTDIGKAFANIAETVNRLHGFGSNKMTPGYSILEDGSEILYGKDVAPILERLVQMGYLRKFVTSPFVNNKRRNWRYRHEIRNVCFGLTAKGWEVAPKFLAILEKQGAIATAELKAKNYFEKVKATNPITYEEALDLALKGVL